MHAITYFLCGRQAKKNIHVKVNFILYNMYVYLNGDGSGRLKYWIFKSLYLRKEFTILQAAVIVLLLLQAAVMLLLQILPLRHKQLLPLSQQLGH